MSYSTEDVYGKKHDLEAVASHLSNKHDFDLPGALKQGYTHSQIIDHLNAKESTQDTHLEIVMCPPKFLSVTKANNAWMKKMDGEDKVINLDRAMAQFFDLYGLLAQDAVVWLLPPKKGLQDAVYVSNAGAVLPHLYKTIILANFKAEGRPGEEKVLSQFLDLMDFEQHLCPYKFEGEAELKWIRENIYIGGHSQRSDPRAYKWMEKEFGCNVILLNMSSDPLRYHLDCWTFPLNKETVLLSEDTPPETRKQIEKVAEIIPVGKKDAQYSLTNCVRIGNIIFNATNISELKRTEKEYEPERHKNEALEKICLDKGLSLVWVNLSEMGKSGAALSCCCMHLNRIGWPK